MPRLLANLGTELESRARSKAKQSKAQTAPNEAPAKAKRGRRQTWAHSWNREPTPKQSTHSQHRAGKHVSILPQDMLCDWSFKDHPEKWSAKQSRPVQTSPDQRLSSCPRKTRVDLKKKSKRGELRKGRQARESREARQPNRARAKARPAPRPS